MGQIYDVIFYHNYRGGSALMAGAVFGRRAGTSAAQRALAVMQKTDWGSV